MFSDQDLQIAIEQGIFDSKNNTISSPAKVIRFFEVWAKNKIAKVRREAAEIAIGFDDDNTKHSKIMNINV